MIFPSINYAQSVSIDEVFTSDATINLETRFGGTCNSSKVSANVILNSDTSLVRIVMVDDNGVRRLIFETYSLICDANNINFNSFSEETMFLPENTKPISLEIYVIDAECGLGDVEFDSQFNADYINDLKQHKYEIERTKVAIMNNKLEAKGLLWRASVSNYSTMSYQNKVNEWGGDKYFIEGYDYYSGGIFSSYSMFDNVSDTKFVDSPHDTEPLVKTKSFDWRTVHDANIPESPYWDGDNDIHNLWNHETEDYTLEKQEIGNGWMTKIKNQVEGECECPGGCYIYAPICALEGVLNLYFNRHLDFDLSEQHLMQCAYANDLSSHCYGGGSSQNVKNVINNNYTFVDETTYPWLDFINLNLPICPPITYAQIEIEGAHIIEIQGEINTVKSALMKYGSMCARPKETHICGLVGFTYVQEGDVLKHRVDHDNNSQTPDALIEMTVPNGHSFIGKTAWIFKESGGVNYGDGGYVIALADDGGTMFESGFYAFETAGYTDLFTPEWHDYDDDGYYNWGIGPKPYSCPGPDLADCNDNDDTRLFYDENYFCTYDCDWVASLMENSPLIINENETIYGALLTQPIIVTNNATLEFIGEFHCSENVYIEAEIGSTILLDGASFLAVCGDWWQGFKLLSNLDSELGTVGRSLLIANNCEISEAIIAIEGDVGSIIRASSTDFVDNKQDIKLEPHTYSSFYSSVSEGNNSEFDNCSFYTSSYAHNKDLAENIELIFTKNISFTNCTFQDQGINIDGFSPLNRTAIKTYRSGFEVTDSHFENLGYATKIYNSLYLPVDLNENLIFNCHYGFYLSQTHGAAIINNNVEFWDNKCQSTYADVLPYAIYIDNCHDFHVEGNIIGYYLGNYYSDKICGIVVNDAGGYHNTLYRNIIRGMAVASQSVGINRDADNASKGLQFLCNSFSRGYCDVFVTNNLNDPYPDGYPIGVADNQGSMPYPAGNRFTFYGPDDYFNMQNDASFFNYYHHDSESTNLEVVPAYINENVNLVPTIIPYNNNSCPDNTNSTVIDTQVGLLALQSIKNDIDNKTNVLNFLIDGGNTDMTVAEILLASDYFAWETYLDLIAKSPYLSKKALKEIAYKEGGLTVPMIRDILVKNPHAAKDPDIKRILKQRIDVLPDYMLEQIEQGLKLVSAKEYLEAQLSSLESEYNRQSSQIMSYYLRNPEQYNDTDIVSLLSLNTSLQSELKLIDYYASSSNYLQAISILSTLDAYKGIEQEDIYYLDKLYNTLISLQEQNLDIANLDAMSINTLQDIEASGGMASAYARGILLLNNAISYKEPVFIPQIDIKPRSIKHSIVQTNNEYFKVYPNPASNYINVEYQLPETAELILLTIYNIEGKIVNCFTLKYNIDTKLIPVSNLEQGAYIVSISANGRAFGEQTISIIR